MYFNLKNPKKTLEKSGYNMQGISNQFRRHITAYSWFHCYIEPDGKGIKIHIDTASQNKQAKDLYKKGHSTVQKSNEIKKEIKRIKNNLSLLEKFFRY